MTEPKVIQIMPLSDSTIKDLYPNYNAAALALMDDGSIRPIVSWIDTEECLHINTPNLAEQAFVSWWEKNFPERKPWRMGEYIVNHASCMLIRQYVEDKEIDTAWLAMEADIDEYILDKILRGRMIPMGMEYYKICKVLGVDLPEFGFKYPREEK